MSGATERGLAEAAAGVCTAADPRAQLMAVVISSPAYRVQGGTREARFGTGPQRTGYAVERRVVVGREARESAAKKIPSSHPVDVVDAGWYDKGMQKFLSIISETLAFLS